MFKSTGSADENVLVKGGEFRRIMRYYKHKWVLFVAMILAIFDGSLPLIMTYILSESITEIIRPETFLHETIEAIKVLAGLVALMIFILSLTFALRGYANPDFVENLRDALFSNIMEQELEYFDETATGVLIARLSEDVTFVLETYVDKMNTVILYLAQIVVSLLFAFIISWRVSMIVIAVVPVTFILFYVSENLVNKLWTEFRDRSTLAAAKAEEVITSFRTVKSFDNELYEADLYARQLEDVHEIVVKASHIHAIKNGIMYFLSWGIMAPVLYYCSYLIFRKPWLGTQLGDLVMLATCFSEIGISVAMTISVVDDLRKAAISAAKLLVIVEKKPERDRKDGNALHHIRGKVEFRNVSFRYRTREDYAVKDLSFTINAGETVAMVGESGCGKTTTLQLLQRFYEIDEGQILIDDVDVRTLSPTFMRSQISCVPQGPVLFSMSILDNIRFGKIDAGEDEAIRAARIRNAHDFIDELPDGYTTEVQSMSLSGGQKQRICISRAILANTPILLLDEATASLDTESEQLVQQSLESFRNGKTAIIVAHRLATVKNADRILVFQNGHIEEAGTHEELLANDGIYADLIRFQLQ